MDPTPASPAAFDPVRHENHVVALFDDDSAADRARSAVLQAGVPPGRVDVLADGAALHAGEPHPVQDLFVPEDDYHDYHHALGRGHAMVVVRPGSAHERDLAVWALEGCAPLDIEQNGRHWRGIAAPVPRLAINHATVSRADMHGRALGGSDHVILDMTGHKMLVREMSQTDMAAAPFAPALPPEQRPAPLAPPVPDRAVPVRGTTYTYGVPMDVVSRMSPEEQVLAQRPGEPAARGAFLKEIGGRALLGWRDRPTNAVRVRSYVTERTTANS